MTIRGWTWLQWAVAVLAALGAAAVVAVPSALIANPFFLRMTPVPWWSYAVWALTAALTGLLVASYVRRPAHEHLSPARAGLFANVASLLAVGCPVCNKLVVAALGVSGALSVWAPLQPLIAVASLALLGWAVWRRLSTPTQCSIPSVRVAATPGEQAQSALEGIRPQ
jgi:hypothetical protein